MNQPSSIPRRWLEIGGTSHVLYETDGGCHRTLCNLLLRGGTIKLSLSRFVDNKCDKCFNKLKTRNLYSYDDEPDPRCQTQRCEIKTAKRPKRGSKG